MKPSREIKHINSNNIKGCVLFFFLFLFASTKSALACPDIDGLVDLNCDRRLTIICFGDSITAGVADEAGLGYPGRLRLLLPNATIFNVGISGERTPTGRVRAPGVFATVANPDYIIILEGVNDFFPN